MVNGPSGSCGSRCGVSGPRFNGTRLRHGPGDPTTDSRGMALSFSYWPIAFADRLADPIAAAHDHGQFAQRCLVCAHQSFGAHAVENRVNDLPGTHLVAFAAAPARRRDPCTIALSMSRSTNSIEFVRDLNLLPQSRTRRVPAA